MILQISYDLHNEKNYDPVIQAIEAAPAHFHVHRSTWLIDTPETTEVWRDRLAAAGDGDDSFLVTRLGGEAPRWCCRNVPGLSAWFKGRRF